MRQQVSRIAEEAREAIFGARSAEELEKIRVHYLGKKGELTRILRGLGQLPADERPVVGQLANEARQEVERLLAGRREEVVRLEKEATLRQEKIDITLPGWPPLVGRRHPLQQILLEIERIFLNMGFEIATGPEVELDYYNFEALNIPADHPARDMQDSFYVTDDILLRTQTSPMQIRYMREKAPALPVRVIVPGRVFRRDDDPTHSPMFHQIEGLVVDSGISLGDLKGVLLEFARGMYGPGARIRFRPSFFPFTEPSAEVDVSCSMCGGDGCRTCGGSGWLEILGSGMVHPQVLRNGGYDPEMVTGFAFGMGLERIAMLKYGVDDIRLFFANDLRFLHQF